MRAGRPECWRRKSKSGKEGESKLARKKGTGTDAATRQKRVGGRGRVTPGAGYTYTCAPPARLPTTAQSASRLCREPAADERPAVGRGIEAKGSNQAAILRAGSAYGAPAPWGEWGDSLAYLAARESWGGGAHRPGVVRIGGLTKMGPGAQRGRAVNMPSPRA